MAESSHPNSAHAIQQFASSDAWPLSPCIVAGLPPNDVLQQTPKTSYVSTNHSSRAPLSTASGDIVVAVEIASAFDQGRLYERSSRRPAGRIGEGH